MDYLSVTGLPFLNLANDNDDWCLENVQMSEIDRYIFWIGGGITFLTTFVLVVGTFRFKELSKQPGDLIIGIAASDFILSIHWFILATFPKNINDNSFCQVVGALGTFAGMNEFLYNVGFSFFLILSLRNALKQAKIPKNRFHVVTLTVSIAYLINMLIKGDIGKTLAGTCSVKSRCNMGFYAYFGGAIAGGYALIGLFTYFYIKKNTPRCASAHAKRTQFLLYYMRYNIACTIIYFWIAILNILITILRRPDKLEEDHERFAWLNSIYNVAKLSSPVVLSIIRFNDPLIKKYWFKTVLFWRKSPTDSEIKKPLVEENHQEDHSRHRSHSHTNNNEEFIFNELSSDWRTELTYTVLACVLYANKLPETTSRRNSIVAQTVDTQAKNPYKHQKVFQIEGDSFKDDLPHLQEELEKRRFNILPGTLKIYSPEVFSEFVHQDKDILDIIESLDFVANREQIKAASDPKGGKSGEFFFFSRDKKLILKTIPHMELKMLISILENYERHHKEYPNSLIAKIYGAYTYENTDVGVKFNLVLMKNICGFPSKFVERAYDMKGSRHDRQVLKLQEKNDMSLLKGLVLKDLDFLKYEKKLNINPELMDNFVNQIEADSLFFRDVNLIDYSFMVFIVNKENANKSGEMEEGKDFTNKNPLASIESTTEPGLYYNMGIIDYLQPYNFQKWFERCLKRAQKFDPTLDTSSQDPHYYSSRFIQFVTSIAKGTNGPEDMKLSVNQKSSTDS